MPIIVGIIVAVFMAFLVAGGAGGIVLVAGAVGGVVWVALVFAWMIVRLICEMVWIVSGWLFRLVKWFVMVFVLVYVWTVIRLTCEMVWEMLDCMVDLTGWFAHGIIHIVGWLMANKCQEDTAKEEKTK